jgi:hypothetical protein
MQPTEVEFQAWLQDDVTKAFFKALNKGREELKESMVRGVFEGSEQKVLGRCEVVWGILNMSYQDFLEMYND